MIALGLFILGVSYASGQSVREHDPFGNSGNSQGISVMSDGTLISNGDYIYRLPVQGPRLQTLVVSYHLQRSWGAGPDVTSSILFQTDALSLTETELDQIPPDRLYNDLVGALAKEGTTVRAGKDTLTILGWSTPNRRDIVLKTPKPQKPRQ